MVGVGVYAWMCVGGGGGHGGVCGTVLGVCVSIVRGEVCEEVWMCVRGVVGV